MIALDATFVTSAASAGDVPADARPQIALVGRSNVGKSSLINALARRTVARTSAAPGKTRLANVYRIRRTGRRDSRLRQGYGGHAEARRAEAAGLGTPAVAKASAGSPQLDERRRRDSGLYLVDLPGYGYARGGDRAARAFARLTAEYFGGGRTAPAPARAARPHGPAAALLVVDSRHPGLETDLEAWRWLGTLPIASGIVATKIDKLGRADRRRAIRELERSFDNPVLPVSATTGEGMEPLWQLIVRLVRLNPGPKSRP